MRRRLIALMTGAAALLAAAGAQAVGPDWTWGQIVTVGAEEARRRMFSSEGAQTALMGAAIASPTTTIILHMKMRIIDAKRRTVTIS